MTSEAQLIAIRWDLDGSGVVDASANATTYSAAFPTAEPQMGCPSAACAGYELAEDISLTSSSGVGWEPIGDGSTGTPPSFSATFEGNAPSYTISNLVINRTTDYVGLFGVTANQECDPQCEADGRERHRERLRRGAGRSQQGPD